MKTEFTNIRIREITDTLLDLIDVSRRSTDTKTLTAINAGIGLITKLQQEQTTVNTSNIHTTPISAVNIIHPDSTEAYRIYSKVNGAKVVSEQAFRTRVEARTASEVDLKCRDYDEYGSIDKSPIHWIADRKINDLPNH